MSDGLKTLHIIIKGSVQGVGYRASAKHHADKFEIKGCVKNLSDGSIEIYAQGEAGNLDEFVAVIKAANGCATIDHISVDEYPSQKVYADFEILF